jgi:hypothetical protein
MTRKRVRVVKSPISPVYRERNFIEPQYSQPLFSIRLLNGMLISHQSEFRETMETDIEESEETLPEQMPT